ncbi:Fc.00g046860.m01.CDS01 [Cosmosporella sp. VM-42]
MGRWRAAVHHLPYPYLIIPPIILAILTIIALFIHSDVNAALLWSQCHSHARIPGVSRIPGLGTPLCYLISFFQAALDSARSTAIMAVVLAFVGGLLTVSIVEAARICNAPNVLIAYPTGAWLVFDLVGGAVVWELVIIPAFLHRARKVSLARKIRDSNEESEEGSLSSEDHGRHLPDTEVIAIPVSVAIGYVIPSFLMLLLRSPAIIGVWLFFPVYVSLIRQATRRIVTYWRSVDPTPIHLESNWWSLLFVYALPSLCSILAHLYILGDMTQRDDRKELTRSTTAFIEIDIFFIALTVLYWMLVEVGWRVPLATVVSSVIVGPGAGTCLGWVYREKLIHEDHDAEAEQRGDEEAGQQADEETPLLR